MPGPSIDTFDAAYYRVPDNEIEWWDQAACRHTEEGRAVDWFSLHKRDVRAAIRVCNTCPVKERCYEFAENNDLGWFVFGGVQRMKRRL
jgi:hypothetical protein